MVEAVLLQLGDALGNADSFQSGAVIKYVRAEGCQCVGKLYGDQCTAAVEGMVTYGKQATARVKSCETCRILEGIVRNFPETFRETDGEGIADLGKGIGSNAYRSVGNVVMAGTGCGIQQKGGAILAEENTVNGFVQGVGVLDHDIDKTCGSGEGILCPGQLVMENDGRDIGAVGKDGAIQSGDTLWNGEGTAERGRAEIQDTAVCIVQEAVLGRESGVARGNVDVLQSGTTCKSTAVESGQACGQMNGGQGGTVQEGIGIYRGDPFGKGHFLQGRTAAEGIFSDRSDACRKLDGFKKGTVGKSVVSHGSKVSDQGHVFDICHLTSPGDVIRAVKVQSAGAGDSHLTGVSVQSPLSSGEGAVPNGPLCRGVCKKGTAVPTFGGGREDEQRQ